MDVAAPGVNVYSTFPNHTFVLGEQNGRSWGYDVGNGTSVSSAIIAAVAALAWSPTPVLHTPRSAPRSNHRAE
ncbi:S8 family serine peptidase [Kocuria sp. CPCC 205300]|uniref:S8 family serine peptidase n=1 Tax=Kocuria sabuli TaxID=3071448 RepID=UPI0036D931D1